MRIQVDDLRTVANRLFDHLEEIGERSIEVDHDYYWIIGDNQLYDPKQNPTDFVLGQLSDDWNELSSMVEGKEPVAYGLVWFAAILRAIGGKVVR